MECVVAGCSGTDVDAGLSFHPIPWEVPELAQRWVHNLTKAGTPSEYLCDVCFVCSRHFSEDELQSSDKVPVHFESIEDRGVEVTSSPRSSSEDTTHSDDGTREKSEEVTASSRSKPGRTDDASTEDSRGRMPASEKDAGNGLQGKDHQSETPSDQLKLEQNIKTMLSLTEINKEIKESLSFDKPNIHKCIAMLEKSIELDLSAHVLVEVDDFVETIQKCRKFAGNTIVKDKAAIMFDKMKALIQTGEEETFHEAFVRAKKEQEQRKKEKLEQHGKEIQAPEGSNMSSSGMLSNLLMRMAAEHEQRAATPNRAATSNYTQIRKEKIVNGTEVEGMTSNSFLMKLLTEGGGLLPTSPKAGGSATQSPQATIKAHIPSPLPTNEKPSEPIVIAPSDDSVVVKVESADSQVFEGVHSSVPGNDDAPLEPAERPKRGLEHGTQQVMAEHMKPGRRPRKSQNPQPARNMRSQEKTADSVDHSKIDVVQGYACKECGYLRQTLEDLQQHIEEMHPEDTVPSDSEPKCLVCGKTENKGDGGEKKIILKNTFKVPGKFSVKLAAVLESEIHSGQQKFEKICHLCCRKIKRVFFARKLQKDLKEKFSETQQLFHQASPKKVVDKKARKRSYKRQYVDVMVEQKRPEAGPSPETVVGQATLVPVKMEVPEEPEYSWPDPPSTAQHVPDFPGMPLTGPSTPLPLSSGTKSLEYRALKSLLTPPSASLQMDASLIHSLAHSTPVQEQPSSNAHPSLSEMLKAPKEKSYSVSILKSSVNSQAAPSIGQNRSLLKSSLDSKPADLPPTSIADMLQAARSSSDSARPKRPHRVKAGKQRTYSPEDYLMEMEDMLDNQAQEPSSPTFEPDSLAAAESDSESVDSDNSDHDYKPSTKVTNNQTRRSSMVTSPDKPPEPDSALTQHLVHSGDDERYPKRRRKNPCNVTRWPTPKQSNRGRKPKYSEDEEPVPQPGAIIETLLAAAVKKEPEEKNMERATPSDIMAQILSHGLDISGKDYIELPWKNGRPEYRCIRCHQPFFTQEGIEMHTKCHPLAGQDLVCCICNFSSEKLPRQWRIVRCHLVEIHGISPLLFAQFPCPVPGCPSLHVTQSDRERHLALGHRMVEALKVRGTEQKHQLMTQGLFDFTCLQCATQLHSEEAFEVHLKCHVLHSKGYRCYLCGYSHPSQPGSWRFMRGHLFKQHVPSIIPHETFHYHECTRYTCRIKFCSANARHIHEACHHDRDESTFRCALCPMRSLLSWEQQARHIIEVHPYLFEPHPFTCSCSLVFHTYNEFGDHVNNAEHDGLIAGIAESQARVRQADGGQGEASAK